MTFCQISCISQTWLIALEFSDKAFQQQQLLNQRPCTSSSTHPRHICRQRSKNSNAARAKCRTLMFKVCASHIHRVCDLAHWTTYFGSVGIIMVSVNTSTTHILLGELGPCGRTVLQGIWNCFSFWKAIALARLVANAKRKFKLFSYVYVLNAYRSVWSILPSGRSRFWISNDLSWSATAVLSSCFWLLPSSSASSTHPPTEITFMFYFLDDTHLIWNPKS